MGKCLFADKYDMAFDDLSHLVAACLALEILVAHSIVTSLILLIFNIGRCHSVGC